MNRATVRTAPGVGALDAEVLGGLIGQMPDGLVVVDRHGVVLVANPAAQRMLRPEGTELVGTSFGALATISDGDDLEIAETGIVAETRVRRVEWEGGPARMVMLRDVTEQRLAEEARRGSVQLLEAIADNTPAAISVRDREGRYVFANRRYEQLVGQSRERLVGRTARDVLGAEIAARRADQDTRVLTEGAVLTSEVSDTLGGGTTVTWLVVLFPIPDEQGRPYAVGSVGVDISEQRRAVQALRESEVRFRLLAERSKDVIFLITMKPTPVLEYISPAVETMFGYPPTELVGDLRHVLKLLTPQARVAAEAELRSPGGRLRMVRHVRPDGSVAWIEAQAVPIHGEDGELVAVEGTLREVTDRVVAEQERLEVARRLEQTERLESLGQLAGGIAHDFNNVLAVIMGTAQLLADDLGPADPRAADVHQIVHAAERGADLTRQLLIFSRREPGRSQLTDLGGVITGLENMMHRTIGEDIDFSCRLSMDLPLVSVDRARMEQVILNLVVNARHAMPDGGALSIHTTTVTLPQQDVLFHAPPTAGPSGPPGQYVLLTVADTGTGMSPEVAAHAFEPFFTTREPGQGTGLGLSTVHGIVTAAGGHITLDSRPGKGTTFRIYLPAAADAPTGATPAATAGTAAGPPGRGETILVVEDEAPVRDVISRILTRSNYQVLTADNPGEAIRMCGEPGTTTDALLTDLVMPGMSGTQLARFLRATRPDLPVLFMSGYPHRASRRTGGDTETGRDHDTAPADATILRKPFDADTLLRHLRRTLDARHPH